eukprot:TRINITY_DN16234_c0_g2_i1.p1 TRINITY_DN16234_c0_g2~~TRINITY_DN16234_c0_g2_i1.p1  ORF type:complete len:204 (-),score=41.87 TRINITY_DN16234_c0_g2_i1:248-859(-)
MALTLKVVSRRAAFNLGQAAQAATPKTPRTPRTPVHSLSFFAGQASPSASQHPEPKTPCTPTPRTPSTLNANYHQTGFCSPSPRPIDRLLPAAAALKPRATPEAPSYPVLLGRSDTKSLREEGAVTERRQRKQRSVRFLEVPSTGNGYCEDDAADGRPAFMACSNSSSGANGQMAHEPPHMAAMAAYQSRLQRIAERQAAFQI